MIGQDYGVEAAEHSLQAKDEAAWWEMLDGWLESKSSPQTRLTYRCAWQRLLRETDKPPWLLERKDLLRWVEGMRQKGDAQSSIRMRLAAVRSFYTALERQGVRNPARGVRVPAGSEAEGLTAAEAEAFLGAIPRNTLNGKRDLALFLCYMGSGRRTSEVCRLQYKQVRLDAGQGWLRWEKGERWRRDRMGQRLQEALTHYLREGGRHDVQAEDYVFTAWLGGESSGRPLALCTVSRLVKKYARQAGLKRDITVSMLRRTRLEEGQKNEPD